MNSTTEFYEELINSITHVLGIIRMGMQDCTNDNDLKHLMKLELHYTRLLAKYKEYININKVA